MIKAIVSVYTCCPNMGSEQGVGWNFIKYLSNNCELYVISEGEYRIQCEADTKEMPIHWYWNEVTQEIRQMCWNQGDWRFYKYYKEWQRKTADIALEICKTVKIDVLHQLNMIGFREPGYLWVISMKTAIPFVWGPIGGLKKFPLAFAQGGGMKMKLFFALKNCINLWQVKYDKRVVAALHQASSLISSIPDSYNAIH